MATKKIAIMRVQKIKSLGGLAGRARHNLRSGDTPNANNKKDNIVRGPQTVAEVTSAWRDATEGLTVRKNAVLAVEYLLTASPEFFAEATKDERRKWAERARKFVEDKHGTENILSEVLHLDEKSPHWHILVVPKDKKGKLNASAFFDGREMMSKLQDDYHAEVAGLGLERGLKGSKAKHQTVKAFYRKVNDASKPIPEPTKADYAAAAVGVETSTLRAYREAVAGLQMVAKAPTREKLRHEEAIQAQKARTEAEKNMERADARADALRRKFVEIENQLALTQEHLREQTKALESQAVELQYLKQQGNKVLPFVKPK
jgi:hypothetical protein